VCDFVRVALSEQSAARDRRVCLGFVRPFSGHCGGDIRRIQRGFPFSAPNGFLGGTTTEKLQTPVEIVDASRAPPVTKSDFVVCLPSELPESNNAPRNFRS